MSKAQKQTTKKGKSSPKVSDKSKKIKKDKPTSSAAEKTLKVVKEKKETTGNRMTRRFNKLRLRTSDLDGSKGIVYAGHLP